jgi:hypothetical protein
MDLSKLPKLSDTKSQEAPTSPDQPPAGAPAVPQASPRPQAIEYGQYPAGNIGGDIWISLIVGILLCLLGGTFARFLIAKATHHHFDTGYTWPDNDPKGRGGQDVDYFDLETNPAWSDMGIFVFGVVLLFEAASKTMLVMKPGKAARVALMLALLLTIAGVGLNLIACVKLLQVGITPLLSGLAVAIGGWILFDEIYTLKRTRTSA